MWAAKDKDGKVFLFEKKPQRSDTLWIFNYEDNGDCYHIDDRLFPNLMWEDEPIEVEIIQKS